MWSKNMAQSMGKHYIHLEVENGDLKNEGG